MLRNNVKDDTINAMFVNRSQKTSEKDQAELERLRKQIFAMIDKLSASDCAEVLETLKERGVL